MPTKTAVPTIWHVPDELWSRLAPLLGPEKAPGTPGRPAVALRVLCDALLYGLRTGCQWRAIPRHADAPGSTVHGRFRHWVKAGVWERAGKGRLAYSEHEVGIAWQWQALDGVITKAPLGGEATGPSPVERAKAGTRRSVLTDRRGAPLAISVTGANPPDKTVALETVDGSGVPRPERGVDRLHHLCLDKGSDDDAVIAGMRERDYRLPLKHRGEPEPTVSPEKKHPARRWVVERTHAWHNKFRRLLVRWERSLEHYKALVHLASVLILYRLAITA
jgi:putative transposase